MIKGILIDMGGTLVYNDDFSFERAVEKIYDLATTKKVTKKEFIDFYNRVYNDCFKVRTTIEIKFIDFLRILIERFKMEYDYTIDELEDIFMDNCSKVRLIEDVEELLVHFKKKGYKIIVLSNTTFSSRGIKRQLDALNKYFDEVIASSDYVVRKPDASFFELGIGRIGLKKEEVLYLGNDFYYDIYGSSLAGINSIWFNQYKAEKNDKYDISCKYIEVNSYKQLIDMDI